MSGLSHSIQFGNCTIVINTISVVVIIISVCIIIITIGIEKKLKNIKEGLSYRDEIFKTLGSNDDNVFWIYNRIEKNFEYISPNFEKVFEISKEELLLDRAKILDYMLDKKKEIIINQFHTLAETKILEEDFEYTKPITGEKCWMILRVYPIFKKDTIVRYVCITTNITREKQSEKEMEEVLKKLNNANEAKKIFLSHVSHELKTPLNAIIGMTQIVSESLSNPEKAQSYLDNIYASSRKLLTLINNILDVSKIDSEKLILSKEPFQLSDTLTSFSAIMKSQAELNNQNYIVSIQTISDDYLLGDSMRLVQILENCISNSIKFTPQGGEIQFEVTEVESDGDKAQFRFTITDTGKGMSKEFLNHLFEPFEQEDNSIVKKYGGTGIGMTIVRELVQLMGGSIQVSSEVNCGTTVTINIEFQINSKLSEAEKRKTVNVTPNQYNCNGKRVLLAEDNEINGDIACELLRNIHLQVETASNGEKAFQLFKESEKGYYDLILMDLQMPVMNGYEAASAIRDSSHPDAKTIPIIAVTAFDFTDTKFLNECGINDSTPKSFEFERFYPILKKFIPNGEEDRNLDEISPASCNQQKDK